MKYLISKLRGMIEEMLFMKKNNYFKKITALAMSFIMLISTVTAVPAPVFVVETANETQFDFYGSKAAFLAEEMPYTVIVGDVFATYENANDIEQDHRNANRKIGINQSFNLHCYPSTSAALRSKQVLTVRDR